MSFQRRGWGIHVVCAEPGRGRPGQAGVRLSKIRGSPVTKAADKRRNTSNPKTGRPDKQSSVARERHKRGIHAVQADRVPRKCQRAPLTCGRPFTECTGGVMKIDCGRCEIRGTGCQDCVITALEPRNAAALSAQSHLGEAEVKALG